MLIACIQVKLFDIIQAQPDALFLVFEFVKHDLKSFMDRCQRSSDISERIGLPLSTVRSFLRQIIAGVGCCHTYRILHRDLKPHNVSENSVSGDVSLCCVLCTGYKTLWIEICMKDRPSPHHHTSLVRLFRSKCIYSY